MKTLLLTFLFFSTLYSFSQSVFERWYGTTLYVQEGTIVLVTADSNYIFTGTSHIDMPPCAGGCFGSAFLMKVDQVGDTIFTKSFADSTHGYSLLATFDGGYLVGGNRGMSSNFLVKTNAAGDTAWTKRYDGYTSGYLLAQSPDSGFFLAGEALLKVNSSGDSLWTKPLGNYFSLIIASIYPSSDSGLFVSAYSSLTTVREILKINSAGDTVWTKLFGNGRSKALKELPDHNLIYVSEFIDTITWQDGIEIMKLDNNGDTIWTQRITGVNSVNPEDILQCRDGGYIVSGWTYDYVSNAGDLLLVKTDSLGITEWTRTFSHNYNDFGFSVKQTFDGGFIVCGLTNDVVTNWESNIYLIKTDSLGNVVQVSTPEIKNSKDDHFIFPNPTSGKFEMNVFEAGENRVEVYDIFGRKISANLYKTSDNKISGDISNQPDGIYLMKFNSGEKIFWKKIIKN